MVYRAAFFLLPLALLPRLTFAQTPPPEVDQALRARVTEFFQDHVDGDFEKAYDLVASDTKKYYFGAQKIQFKSFKIDSIAYDDHLDKATVTVTADRMMRIRIEFPETQVSVPMSTNWKLENGKWVWYRDTVPATWLTPMGPSDQNAIKAKPGQAAPQELTSEMISERAKAILAQSQPPLNKEELKLSVDKVSSDELSYHNAAPGQVTIALIPGTLPAGFTAKLDKTDLKAGENAVLKVHYEPATDSAKPIGVTLKLMIAPFNKVLSIPVQFEPGN